MTLPKTNNKNTNQTTRLSVQISLTGLSFFEADTNGTLNAYHAYHFDFPIAPEELQWHLEKALNEHSEWSSETTEITVIHASNLYTLVPAALFEESRASDYLKFNTKILSNDYVGFDRLDEWDLVIVYLPFISANNFLFEKFGSFDYYHSATRLLEYVLKESKYEIKPKVYLHVETGYFDCIVIKNGKLELMNSFSYKTPEDFIYFVLFCFEQLGINPNEVETYLSGAIHLEDPLYEILYTYVRHVSFLESRLPSTNDLKSHEELVLKTTL